MKAVIGLNDETLYCAAVGKCPRLNKTSAEVYNEPSCTTETKFYNDTCELSCNIGYKLSRADGVRTCTENGTWSNPVKCERMSRIYIYIYII